MLSMAFLFLGAMAAVSTMAPFFFNRRLKMIIVMQKKATEPQIEAVLRWIESIGYKSHPSHGIERTIIGVIGDDRHKEKLRLAEHLPGVEKVVPILKPYKLASRESREGNTVVKVGQVAIGGGEFVVMAGPCSIESEEQLMESAYTIKKGAAHILRGGAYKPRTSPYSFQGMEEEGLKLLQKAREKFGLPVITEVMNTTEVDLVEEYSDLLQIGTRNAQNFPLLKKVGKCQKPVVLKRGMMMTIEELLMSAEYILSEGNEQVILCERGIRTFETATRNTLDISAVPVLKGTHPFARHHRSQPCLGPLEICYPPGQSRGGRGRGRHFSGSPPRTGKGDLRRAPVPEAGEILSAHGRNPDFTEGLDAFAKSQRNDGFVKSSPATGGTRRAKTGRGGRV